MVEHVIDILLLVKEGKIKFSDVHQFKFGIGALLRDVVSPLTDSFALGRALPMMMAILSIVSFSSIGSLGQSTFPHSGNPFAYVGRTVSKFDSVDLCNGKRPDGFKAHHRDLNEI